MNDYELCQIGQDGIRFHACISWIGDHLHSISFYDHEGPNRDGYAAAFWFDGKWGAVSNKTLA
jgi:hypothetical protein